MSMVATGTAIHEVEFKRSLDAPIEKNTCIGDKQLAEFTRLAKRAGHIVVSSKLLWTHGG